MPKNKKLGVIIPIHQLEENNLIYFKSTLDSLNDQINKDYDLYVVYNISYEDKIKNFISDYYNNEVTYLPKKKNFSYQRMVNYAVKKINNEYFSILQYDDMLNNRYVDFFHIYRREQPENMYLMLSMERIGDTVQGLKNETFWAYSSNMGYADEEKIKKSGNLSLVGAIFNRKEFLELKGFKENLEVFSCYEYALRYVANKDEIYTIPHCGTYHQFGLEGSMLYNFDKENDTNMKKNNLINAQQMYLIIPDKIII